MINDIINGLWSGIPLCCILFFLKKSRLYKNNLGYIIDKKRGNNIKLVKLSNGNVGFKPLRPEVEYVQCDYCFNHNITKKLRHGGIWISLIPFKIQKW